jgi:Zn-dependent metalloprotease
MRMAITQDDFGKACVAEWDSTSYSTSNPPCLRRLDNNKVYPSDMQGEVHADGEIWSQGLYDMAQAFGRDVATRIILQSHWSLTPNATFHDGAKAIKQADVTLFGGGHGAKIDQIWAARGISTE